MICDGIVGRWFIEVFRAVGEACGIPLHYVVLRPDEPTTLTVRPAAGTMR